MDTEKMIWRERGTGRDRGERDRQEEIGKKEKVSKGEIKKKEIENKGRDRERDRDKMRDRKLCKRMGETERYKEGGYKEIQQDIEILTKICQLTDRSCSRH
jgi:hypothetical protein